MSKTIICMDESEEQIIQPLKITLASDLVQKVLSEPVPEFIWNGIKRGSKGLFTGIGKSGKTTIAENLAISIAVGKTEFFGYPLIGIPEKVLFINLEESYQIRTCRTINQIQILSKHERKLFDSNFISTPEDFPDFLKDDADWTILHNYIKTAGADVIFIDSLSHMVKGAIEKSEVFLKFVQKFRYYVGSLKKTVIVIHHNTKGNDKPMTQDMIAGSRVVSQEFEYAIGLSAVPLSQDSYMCMLYNKFIRKSDIATTFTIDESNWVEFKQQIDKNKLYGSNKVDLRQNSKNKDLIYEYIRHSSSLDGLGSIDSKHGLVAHTSELLDAFVKTGEMTKATMYACIEKLRKEDMIFSPEQGMFKLKTNKDDATEN